tara:strand:+ start:278 stop:430 length:153 start_codon:yes stop_codon:yes gene_type:complete
MKLFLLKYQVLDIRENVMQKTIALALQEVYEKIKKVVYLMFENQIRYIFP